MDQVDTLHGGRYWSEVFMLYHNDPPTWVTLMLKFFVKVFISVYFFKVFISLYLLNMMIDQVDTLHGGRYWSEVLYCTIMTNMADLEVKVMDLEVLC